MMTTGEGKGRMMDLGGGKEAIGKKKELKRQRKSPGDATRQVGGGGGERKPKNGDGITF